MKVLVLKIVDRYYKSYGGFRWPKKGKVVCPDWEPTKECGNGLHGFLWGEGESLVAVIDTNSHYLVLSVDSKNIINLNGKVKFPECNVVFSGSRKKATEFILKRKPSAECMFATKKNKKKAVVGDYGIAVVEDNGIAIAGNKGTAKAGKNGVAQVISGKAFVGDFGTATVINHGIALSGNHGRSVVQTGAAVSKDYGTSMGGFWAFVKAGKHGKATAGSSGVAVVGNYGLAIVGCGGCAKAGHNGTIKITYYSYTKEKYKTITGKVGKDIKANTFYIANYFGKFEELEKDELWNTEFLNKY